MDCSDKEIIKVMELINKLAIWAAAALAGLVGYLLIEVPK